MYHDIFIYIKWFILQGDFSAAAHQFRLALVAIGRPLPTSKIDLGASIMWQIFRQFLHKVYVGRWLFCRSGKMRRKPVEPADVKNSARDGATVYFKLHQLHLAGMLTWPLSCWITVNNLFSSIIMVIFLQKIIVLVGNTVDKD